MTTYIAHFTANHSNIAVEQNSIFIWQQESGEVDTELLSGKIIRESAVHFYRLVTEEDYSISMDDISVIVQKAMPFSG